MAIKPPGFMWGIETEEEPHAGYKPETCIPPTPWPPEALGVPSPHYHPHAEKLIYLAGPMSGLDYETARYGWRKQIQSMLAPHIKCLSPMRGSSGEKGMLKDTSGNPKMEMKFDKADVRRCDMMIANFNECLAGYVSIGTCVEFGWADAWDKPIIMIIAEQDREKNPHWHAFLREIAATPVETVERAAKIANDFLTHGI